LHPGKIKGPNPLPTDVPKREYCGHKNYNCKSVENLRKHKRAYVVKETKSLDLITFI
jgi:ribosomal protein S10